MRGRNQVEAASGVTPILPKTKPMRAFSEASRMSIAQVIVAPMPTAAPLIAPITGFLQLKMARVTRPQVRSEEHTSELQSLMSISYSVVCLKKNKLTHKYD